MLHFKKILRTAATDYMTSHKGVAEAADSSWYLTIGVVSKSFVGFIKNHTLYFFGRTYSTGQIIHHYLRSEEENLFTIPNFFAINHLSPS